MALLGTLVAPLAAVPVLVLGAHLVATSAIGTGWPARFRWPGCAVASLAALGVAVLATGDRPWAVAAATPSRFAWPLVAVVVLAAVLSWARLRWLRPVAAATLALGGCALVTGTTTGELSIAVPAAAFLAAATLDDQVPEPRLARS